MRTRNNTKNISETKRKQTVIDIDSLKCLGVNYHANVISYVSEETLLPIMVQLGDGGCDYEIATPKGFSLSDEDALAVRANQDHFENARLASTLMLDYVSGLEMGA